ncbi:MAG TPA: acetolactate synthase small subunit [SAR86 cluster bacterium]|jgi:acetolactate synthase-1/3 small subunit|nr:acetolactate synthase small subunit [SAR86 cluster bacterium]|tara:strand:- start:15 stop:494 length:480 start_codon:yes stop_codon:yes gene_type:complete
MKRVIALLMENQPGALSRVVGLFSQRGYNIETLIVAPTSDPTLSRLTMTTNGDEKVVQQITKQLDKLIDVVTVSDLGESDFVERELMLVKFNKNSIASDEIEKFEGKVVFEDNEIINLQFVGEPDKLDKLVETLNTKEPLEIVRSGSSGISSNSKTLTI